MNLPGRWYLEVIKELFKENRFAKGTFVGLGRCLDLENITCPSICSRANPTISPPKEQVFDAEKYLGTPKDKIEKKLVPGGHIGLFMGSPNPPRGLGRR